MRWARRRGCSTYDLLGNGRSRSRKRSDGRSPQVHGGISTTPRPALGDAGSSDSGFHVSGDNPDRAAHANAAATNALRTPPAFSRCIEAPRCCFRRSFPTCRTPICAAATARYPGSLSTRAWSVPAGYSCAFAAEAADGHDYAADAFKNGASALLVEHFLPLAARQVRTPRHPSRARARRGRHSTAGPTSVWVS